MIWYFLEGAGKAQLLWRYINYNMKGNKVNVILIVVIVALSAVIITMYFDRRGMSDNYYADDYDDYQDDYYEEDSFEKYVGTWYNIEGYYNEFVITGDKRYAWGYIGGVVSETESGIIFFDGDLAKENFSYSYFDDIPCLVDEHGYHYVQDYDMVLQYSGES